ncbi:MAG: hypothetical protein INR70_38010 [Parafilimonas terrae]|nr:hypothetical protein [Parafilimonas terrae]
MITLLLLAITVAAIAASAAAAVSRPLDEPLPVEASLPAAALGLSWRRLRQVQTRNGTKVLWAGEGDEERYSRAYNVARDALRGVGFSWGTAEREGGRVVPLCWEDPAAAPEALDAALVAADEALVRDDLRLARVEQMRREARENSARLVADDSRAALAALRESLDKLHWAWPKKKRAIAEELLREPMELDDVPRVAVAEIAVKLTAQVAEAVAAVRARVAADPVNDWLERARDPEVRLAVHVGLKILSEMDEDRATLDNGYGWGRSHSHAGHVLANLPELSIIEASQGLAAVWRHRKQLRPEIRQSIFGSAEA